MRARVEKVDVLGWNKYYTIYSRIIANIFHCYDIYISDGTFFTILCGDYVSQILFGVGELISKLSKFPRSYSVGLYIL